MVGVVVVVVALVVATVFGVVWRRRNGRLRPQPATGPEVTDDRARLSAADLGVDSLGERSTLVQFSSAFCAPCRATRRILDEVAQMVDGVRYVEIDAESRLDLVRRLGVLRTPTVLVLDGAGRIVRRGSGQPRKPDIVAALGVAITS
ncbi:MAG TPA: thioredoxin family protein [Streptosporangiaceae bacterium]|jgi:thiol-disulfide isomerase/thioredoxin